ncbi:MAG: hypothetical protein CFH05_00827, partial [Alphaproteobacteria bacterium MarineAlpha3_Bin4]
MAEPINPDLRSQAAFSASEGKNGAAPTKGAAVIEAYVKTLPG